MGLAGPLRRRAGSAPGATALVHDGTPVSRADLLARTAAAAGSLADSGVVPGSRCLLVLDDPLSCLVALAACDVLGATAVVGDPGWPRPVRAAVAAAAAADHTLTTVARGRPGTPLPAVTGDIATPWLATCTSGSTGTPRAVRRTRASWLRSYAPFSAVTGTGPAATVLVPGRLSGSLSLFGAVHALACAGPLLLEPVTTGSRWEVAHLLPAHLDALLATDHDLHGRTAVVAGAAPARPAVQAARRRGLDVLAYYGATELSFVAVGAAAAPLHPFPWVEVDLRDGEVWVRSPYVALDVLGGGAGPWRRDAEGWSTVGDLAAEAPGGGLEVLGRRDAAVTTGGSTVCVEGVESVLRGLPGIVDALVLGTPHPQLGQVVTAVVVVSGEPSPGRWRGCVAELLPAPERPRRWYAVPALPVTASGKPDRAVVAERLADGSLGARPLP